MDSKGVVLVLAICVQLCMLFNAGMEARVLEGMPRDIDVEIDEDVLKTYEKNVVVYDPLENPPRPPVSQGPPSQINPVPPPAFPLSQTYVHDSDENAVIYDPLENPPRPPVSQGPPGQINPVPPPAFPFDQTYV